MSQRLVYELHNKDTILFRLEKIKTTQRKFMTVHARVCVCVCGCSPGDKTECWYYVLTGSVMLSMNYFFSTGSR